MPIILYRIQGILDNKEKFQPVRVMDNLLVKEKEIAQREERSREEKERKNVPQLYLVKRCPPGRPFVS